MPALKGADLGGGPWTNPNRRGGRISRQLCPICRTPLHEELVARNIHIHPCCGSDAVRLHDTS